ncbi:MAG: DNA-directed RNA polymerase [Euryarchaeota archaeon]|nr:DNA-directed RNA polymerase [Euryarchaeota archaeon]
MAVQELHTVECSRCGQNAETPFEPEGRPVLCETCFVTTRPDHRF